MTDSEKEWMVRMAGIPFVEFTPSVKGVFGCRPPASLVRVISRDLGIKPDLGGRKYLPEIEEPSWSWTQPEIFSANGGFPHEKGAPTSRGGTEPEPRQDG